MKKEVKIGEFFMLAIESSTLPDVSRRDVIVASGPQEGRRLDVGEYDAFVMIDGSSDVYNVIMYITDQSRFNSSRSVVLPHIIEGYSGIIPADKLRDLLFYFEL